MCEHVACMSVFALYIKSVCCLGRVGDLHAFQSRHHDEPVSDDQNPLCIYLRLEIWNPSVMVVSVFGCGIALEGLGDGCNTSN